MIQNGPQNLPRSSPDASESPPRTSLWAVRTPMRRRGGPQRADPLLLHKTNISSNIFASPPAPRPRPQTLRQDHHFRRVSLIQTHTHAPGSADSKGLRPSAADPKAPPPKRTKLNRAQASTPLPKPARGCSKRQQQNFPNNSTCMPANGITNQLDLRGEKFRALVLDNLEPSNHRNHANLFHFLSRSMRLRPASTQARSVL